MNRQIIINDINIFLARFQYEVKFSNASSFFDINLHAENILIPILNLAYNFELKNINDETDGNKNFPAIDLIDKKKKIGIQVTSRNDITKVKDTIAKFMTKQELKNIDSLYMMFLSDKQGSYSEDAINKVIDNNSTSETTFKFDVEKNIYDLSDIAAKISYLSDEKLQKIHAILESNFSEEIKQKKEFAVSIIDNYFKNNMKNMIADKFEFYTSKTRDSQWYGLHKNWDGERSVQNKIETQIQDNLNKDKLKSKVVSVVYGSGGSGKSILLRRVAINLVQDGVEILWLNNANSFFEYITKCELDKDIKYLVFIEDWYRLSQQYETLSSLIELLVSIDNVRIVIGDRDIKNKIYMRHLYNPDENKHYLDSSENDKLVKEIIKKVPLWKLAFEKISKVDNYSSSPLFIILFLLVKVSEDEKIIDSKDLTSTFRNIIKNDIKKIAEIDKGMAYALQYWAYLYRDNKLFLSIRDFFHLIDLFNENTNASSFYSFSDEDPIFTILKSYLYVEHTDFKTKELNFERLSFNHDLLAEEGLAYLDLLDINTSLHRKIYSSLSSISTIEDYTKSKLFSIMLIREYFKDTETKIDAVEKLLEKNSGSKNYIYMIFVFKNKTLKVKYKTYAKELLERNKTENIHFSGLISICLNILKDCSDGKKYAKELLEISKTEDISQDVISTCLNTLKDDEYSKEYAKELLKRNETKNTYYPGVINNCLNIIKDSNDAKKYANKFLEKNKTEDITHDVINTCLSILKNSDESKKYAKELLEKNRIKDIDKEVISRSLNILKDDGYSKKYAKELLEISKTEDISQDVINTCLNILKDDEYSKKYAKELLEKSKTVNIDKEVISRSLIILKNDEYSKKYAKELLEKSKTVNIDKGLISRSLNISKNSEYTKEYTKNLLEKNNYEDLDWGIVFQCLQIYAYYNIDSTIIDKVIRKKKEGKEMYFQYKNILKIPFIYNKSWMKEVTRLINNWYYEDNNLIANILLTYKDNQESVQNLCYDILRKWKKQVEFEHKRHKKVTKYWYISTSLDYLKDDTISTQVAIEIIDFNKEKNIIPKPLIDKCQEILE